MDQFLVSILLLDEIALMGVAFLLIILGGILGSRIFDVKIALRRVSYIWFIALSGLALSITQFIWIFTPDAAEAGLISPLILFGLGCFAVFGVALYYASAARSQHIGGDTSNAWLGFVPFANLWLMFANGQAKSPDTPARGAFARFVIDPLLVIGAIFVLALTQVLDKAMEEAPAYNTSDSAALRNLTVQGQTLEQSFASEARLSSAQLPIQIDEITTLSAISAEGRTLRITYDLSREIGGFRPDFKATLAGEQCEPTMFADDLARGGTILIVYRGPDGRIVQTYEITQADCRV